MDTSTPDLIRVEGQLEALAGATVAILAGGRSNERDVSLRSSREVAEALRRRPEGDARGPARVLSVEVTGKGRWITHGAPRPPAEALGLLGDVDVFFLGLHGGDGENGVLQGLLTATERPFTGTGVLGSAVAMDKVFGRELLALGGARVARAELVARARFQSDPEAVLSSLAALGPNGWVVKPRSGGSSVGCTLALDRTMLRDGLTLAFTWEEEALVEERILGVEATAGVVTNPKGDLCGLPALEIRPHEGRFFDYEEKYSDTGAEEICPPRSFSKTTLARLAVLAELAHRTLQCAGYSRSDFMIPHGEDEPVFLETNTLPGLTPRSLVPQEAQAAGIDYRTLCLWIAADGLSRGARRDGR